MNQFGYVDIENDELQKYFDDVQKKIGVCDILPSARFALRTNGVPTYDGLVCSEKMGGRQTGVAAGTCKNCKLEREGKLST
jgi:hypothetical protein